MSMKDKLAKLVRAFGFVYFLLNCVILIVICILGINAMIKTTMSPGFMVLILPLIGIFAGYWMRVGRYGWWRILIIAVSRFLTGAIAFTAIFIAPKMEKLKQNKFETNKEIKTLDPEVKKMFLALYLNDLDTVRQQLEKGVNVNARDDADQTPLHITQNKSIAKMLISKSADVNAVDDMGMTPIFNKDVDLSKILVAAGADIHLRSNKGNTPLIWYSYSGYLEGVKYLVSLGADVNAKNSDGQTAYDIAEKFAHFNLLEYLKSIGAKRGKEMKLKISFVVKMPFKAGGKPEYPIDSV